MVATQPRSSFLRDVPPDRQSTRDNSAGQAGGIRSLDNANRINENNGRAASRSIGSEADKYNRATFKPVETTALRIEVQLKPNLSAGILEWKMETAK